MPEIPTYSYEELQRLNLPGYDSPASAAEVLSNDSDWYPVLSISVFRHNPDDNHLQTLTGVRRDTSQTDSMASTHDGVVSTPTMQLRAESRHIQGLAEYRVLRGYAISSDRMDQDPILHMDAPYSGEFGQVVSFAPNPEPMHVALGGNLSYFAGKLIDYKLGLPNLIDANAIGVNLGSVSLASLHIGFSAVGDDHDQYEPLAEFAAVVHLTPEAAALVPAENDKYAYLSWTAAAEFAQRQEKRDVFGLAPRAGDAAVLFCAYGMCLKATREVTIRSDLLEHLALIDPTMSHRFTSR